MSKVSSNRVFSVEFKVEAVRRMLSGEVVTVLARELQVLRKDLYVWRKRFEAGGAAGFRPRGRPPRAVALGPPPEPPASDAEDLDRANRRIAGLELLIGRQQVDIDFFRQALRRLCETRPAGAATPSMRLSRR